MATELLGIIFGLMLLVGGGAALVHSASQLAARVGISPLVVGLTVVAFGTSFPELVVSVLSASRGETGLAFGNIVGSNVINLALVLGVAALIKPISIQGQLVQREIPLLLLASAVLCVMAMDSLVVGLPGQISRSDALVLLLLFGIFLYITIFDFVRDRQPDQMLSDIESNPMIPAEPTPMIPWVMLPASIAMLYFGGELTVEHSVSLATRLQVPSVIIGLFIIALGTSMPELVTTIIAAIRRESDLALGNVIGSNLFNSLFVLPITASVKPVPIPVGGVSDLLLSLLFTAALIPIFIFGKARLKRGIGCVFLLVFATWALIRTIL